jgi:hypothetical protein
MKKSFLFVLLFLAASSAMFAQNSEHKNTVSVTTGLNVLQFVSWVLNSGDSELGESSVVNFSATPSFGITYDRSLKSWFSLGGAVSFNSASFDGQNLDISEDDGSAYTGDAQVDYRRITVSLRPLFHYANRGRIDLYSGFRVGAKLVSADVTSNGETLDPEEVNAAFRGIGRVNFQFIPFAMRGYITQNIGLGFELGFGAPHYAALQLNYRF